MVIPQQKLLKELKGLKGKEGMMGMMPIMKGTTNPLPTQNTKVNMVDMMKDKDTKKDTKKAMIQRNQTPLHRLSLLMLPLLTSRIKTNAVKDQEQCVCRVHPRLLRLTNPSPVQKHRLNPRVRLRES